MAIERGSWSKFIFSEPKHCAVTQLKTVLMLARIVVGKQLFDQMSFFLFGTNQLKVSTLIYIYMYNFCPQVVEHFGFFNGQWKLMFAHCMMQTKVNAINFIHTLHCLKVFVKLPCEREDTSTAFHVFLHSLKLSFKAVIRDIL